RRRHTRFSRDWSSDVCSSDLADVYRPIIDDEASDFNYYRGNVAQEVARNADGTFKKVEAAKYDTLADGRLVYRGLPGQYERETRSEERRVGKECRSRWMRG